MQVFRDILDECGFVDLGFVGNEFTWCKNDPDGCTSWERLDRAVCNDEWLSYFLASKVVHLECGSSNYKPIIINPLGIPQRRQKPWCFEQVWLVD